MTLFKVIGYLSNGATLKIVPAIMNNKKLHISYNSPGNSNLTPDPTSLSTIILMQNPMQDS